MMVAEKKKTGTNLLKLSPTNFIPRIRHQHDVGSIDVTRYRLTTTFNNFNE